VPTVVKSGSLNMLEHTGLVQAIPEIDFILHLVYTAIKHILR
jgi:hypothetical protein